MSKPTTLDYIILGLLRQEQLSGYRIRKTFEETALGNFGGSPGSIYPALNRLTKNEFIMKFPVTGTQKHEFGITATGSKVLKAWLEKSPDNNEIQKDLDLLILKFAFMDSMVDTYQKVEFLQRMLNALQLYLDELEDFYVHQKKMMPLTGQLSFEYGLLSYSTAIQWCENAIETILQDQ